MNLFKRNIDIILILVVGFLLRFTISFTHSYSNDELSAVSRLRYDNFNQLIELGVQKGDMHPAGVQVFMKGWSLLVGKSEMAMRFPFVLFGTVAILVLFLIGKQWFNRKVGLISAGLLAVLYFPVMNSEFARPYSPGLLISLLIGLYFYKVLFESQKSIKNAILLGVLFAAGMYTHYFSFLFVAFIGATGVFFLNRENWKYYIGAGGLGIFLFLPHLGVTLYHLGVGGLQWLAPPDTDWLFQFLFHAFNASWWVVIPVILLTGVAIFIPNQSGAFNKRNVFIAALWFFGIYFVGHVLSYLSTPVLKFPVMLFALPYFLLLLAILLQRIPKTNWLLVGLMGVIVASTVKEKRLYENVHYALFKEVGIKIAGWNNEFGADNIYTVYNINNPSYMNFYVDAWEGDSIQFDWDVLEFDSDVELRSDLMEREEEYCVIGYSSRLTLVQVFETVKEFYPVVVDYKCYNNGSVFLMKKGAGENKIGEVFEIARFNHETKIGGWESEKERSKNITKMDTQYAFDSENIYGPTFRFKSTELPALENGYLKVVVQADLKLGDQLTVALTGERNAEVIQYRGENMWIGHDLEKMILSTDNNLGYFAFKIPPYILSTDELKISLWNRNGGTFNVQSFHVYYVENKWN